MDSLSRLVSSIFVLLSLIQGTSAYCVGYCWYGSWYIWFAVVMTLAICCGALGSYLRRRRIQQAIRHGEVMTVQVAATGAVLAPTSDINRPYVYPGAYPHQQAVMTPPPYCMAGGGANPAEENKKSEMGLPPSYDEATTMSEAGGLVPQPGSGGQLPYPMAPQAMSYPPGPPGTNPTAPYPLTGVAPYPPAPAPYPTQPSTQLS